MGFSVSFLYEVLSIFQGIRSLVVIKNCCIRSDLFNGEYFVVANSVCGEETFYVNNFKNLIYDDCSTGFSLSATPPSQLHVFLVN